MPTKRRKILRGMTPVQFLRKLKFGVEYAIWIYKIKGTLASLSDGRIGCQSRFLLIMYFTTQTPHMHLLLYHYFLWVITLTDFNNPSKAFWSANQIPIGITSPIANVKLVFTNLVSRVCLLPIVPHQLFMHFCWIILIFNNFISTN
jgi:hypothetical protein